jgi:hypothetical protein
LTSEAPQCWGHVGRGWLEWLVAQLQADRAALTARIEAYRKIFLDSVSGKIAGRRQLGRVAQRFALLYAAGRLAYEAGILPWDLDNVMEAVRLPFNANADDTGGLEGEEARILRQIYEMCRTQPARFEVAGNHIPVRDCVGHRYMREDAVWDFYFSPPGLMAACPGYKTRQITKYLVKHGWLKLDDKGKTKRDKVPNGGGGGQLYYFIAAETLNKYEDAQNA